MIKKCLYCKKKFSIIRKKYDRGSSNCFRKKFCSKTCAGEYRKKYLKKNRLKHECLNCGNIFYTANCLKHKCCSKKCAYEYRRKQTIKKKTIKCVVCGTEALKKYCSKKCKLIFQRERRKRYLKDNFKKVKCDICKKNILRRKNCKNENNFCSHKCQYIGQSIGLVKIPTKGNTGYRIDLNDGNYYRSGLEADYARYLTYKKIQFLYQTKTFGFKTKIKTKHYTPDFFLIKKKVYKELKGYIKGFDNSVFAKKLNKRKDIKCDIITSEYFYKMLIKQKLVEKIPNLEYKQHHEFIVRKSQLIDIEEIEEIDYNGEVIDIEVEDEKHPYFFVSNDEEFILTHNSKTPDIDTDFPDDKREEVRQHIIEEYGKEKVAQVVAYSTMSINMCFRDVARVYSLPLEITTEIAKQLVTQGEGYKSYITLEENEEMNNGLLKQYYEEPQPKKEDKEKTEEEKVKAEERKKIETHIAIIRSEFGPVIKEIFSIVKRLQHQMRHASIAAAASVITEKEIYNYCSLKRTKDGLAIEFDGMMISKTNMLKMDLLGIRCLKIIKETLDLLKAKGINVNLYDLKLLEDKDTLDLFRNGDTLASFQFDSHGIREILKNMKPTSFEDIIAAAALYRPGPLSSGIIDVFCKRKNGTYIETDEDKKNAKFLKYFNEILKDTYGVVVYQEQLIFLFNKVFGLNMGDADLLRRAIDEKNKDNIKIYIDMIKANIDKSVIKDEQTMQEALDYIGKISGYSFNKSHSCGYAYVAFWTMYLKAHYPLEFGLTSVNNRLDSHEILRDFQAIWKAKCGIEFVTIDVNKSKDICVYDEKDKKIYACFTMLTGIGASFSQKIMSKQPFRSIEHFATSLFSKKGFEAFTKIGALDNLMQQDYGYVNRKELYFTLFSYQYKIDVANVKKNMDEEEFLALPRKKGQGYTFKQIHDAMHKMNHDDYTVPELKNFEKEYFEALLFSSTLKETEEIRRLYRNITGTQIHSFGELLEDAKFEQKVVILLGDVDTVEERISGKGNKFYYVTLDDGNHKVKCLVWQKNYETNLSKFKLGKMVLIAAKRSTWKEKYVSFLIENKYEEHGAVLSERQLNNLVYEKEDDGNEE